MWNRFGRVVTLEVCAGVTLDNIVLVVFRYFDRKMLFVDWNVFAQYTFHVLERKALSRWRKRIGTNEIVFSYRLLPS